MILAGIDIGTNSLRLLIANVDRDSFREIYSDRRSTRLGQGLDRTGVLAREARDRSLNALGAFAESIHRCTALQVAAIGTSALRNASNTPDFIQEAKQSTGLAIDVITGEEEARLTLLGVAHSLKVKRRGKSGRNALEKSLLIDIGGGSTEIIITDQGRANFVTSLPLGAVYLSERFIRHDPPAQHDIELMRSALRSEIVKVTKIRRPSRSSVFAGTAGTIATLVSMVQGLDKYDHERINGTVLERDSVDDIVDMLCRMTANERKSIRGLEVGREDIILAGAVVTQEIMKQFGYVSLMVSDWGLREGIVLDLYEKSAKSQHH
jgi:exopolyphosphatase / guanosine-5'-triphosphate,3'-diphosphate pyrophosphatase